MVNNNNLIPKENIIKTEEIREIKNETPSFEEFMKTYEVDERVENSYQAELESYGDIGNKKGYGPIGEYWQQSGGTTGCGQVAQTTISRRIFCLNVKCYNSGGGGGNRYAYSTSQALQYARELENGYYFNVSSIIERRCATLVREAVRSYNNGNEVNGYVKVWGKF